jgi:hypothetical protein
MWMKGWMGTWGYETIDYYDGNERTFALHYNTAKSLDVMCVMREI